MRSRVNVLQRRRCVYDTVGDFGWHQNIANHRIDTIIKDVLEKYNSTPPCEPDDECVDCYKLELSSCPVMKGVISADK